MTLADWLLASSIAVTGLIGVLTQDPPFLFFAFIMALMWAMLERVFNAR